PALRRRCSCDLLPPIPVRCLYHLRLALLLPRPPSSTLFPYTTLFRSGPKSNVEFLERLVRHPAIVEATIDTGYLDRHLDQFMPAAGEVGVEPLIAAAVARLLDQERRALERAAASPDPSSPWAIADGWRLGHG